MVLWLAMIWMACAERLGPAGQGQPPALAPERWAALLERAVTEQGVLYGEIERQREVLDDYMRWVAVHGPQSEDWTHAQEDKKLAFLINAYNAAVIFAVLQQKPLSSVRDLKVGLFRIPPGIGFFVGQKFRIDGEWIDLYTLEHQTLLGNFEEPLIHAALNCASQGCPPPRYYRHNRLQGQLQQAMRDYLASPRGMRRGREGWAISELFLWFADQLVDWSDASDICAFLAPYAQGEGQIWLQDQIGACQPATFPYDWSLNEASGSGGAG